MWVCRELLLGFPVLEQPRHHPQVHDKGPERLMPRLVMNMTRGPGRGRPSLSPKAV